MGVWSAELDTQCHLHFTGCCLITIFRIPVMLVERDVWSTR